MPHALSVVFQFSHTRAVPRAGTAFPTPHSRKLAPVSKAPGLQAAISKPNNFEPGGRSAKMPAAFCHSCDACSWIVEPAIKIRRPCLPGISRQSIRHLTWILPGGELLPLTGGLSRFVVHHDNVFLHRIVANCDSARVVSERRRGLHWEHLDVRPRPRFRWLACRCGSNGHTAHSFTRAAFSGSA